MFTNNYDHSIDHQLITKSLQGNKTALTQLIKRHQDYIFNISLRLFLDHDDALDATQEVLIKVITNLRTYRGKSQFGLVGLVGLPILALIGIVSFLIYRLGIIG